MCIVKIIALIFGLCKKITQKHLLTEQFAFVLTRPY